MMTVANLDIQPLPDAEFGGLVRGIEPGALTEGTKAALQAACRDRQGLLCFQFDRLLQGEEMHAITAIFGEREFSPGKINNYGKKAAPGEENLSIADQITALRARGIDPWLHFLGNVDPDTLAVKPVDGKFFGEWEWHTDMSYIATPPTFSLLHARRVPDEGGDTGFCSQTMAAAALPDGLRNRLAGLRIKHDSTYSSSGILRPGMAAPASPIEAQGSLHPILRQTPCGEALFLGRRTNAWVEGLPLGESEALLDELWYHATRPAFQYRHRWQVGQLVIWDNRVMLHMRHPVDERQARFMWRTQTKGEAVVQA